MTTLPDETFVEGEAFQFKHGSTWVAVRLRSDPDGSILYWTGENISEFVFFDDVVDVRVQRFLQETESSTPLYSYSLTVVLSTDMVKVDEFALCDIRKPIVDIWADFIFSWSSASKRRYCGLLHHFKKALAPSRFVFFREKELLDIYTVADVVLPNMRNSAPYSHLVNALFTGKPFQKKKAIRKDHVTDRNLSEMVVAATELLQNPLLLEYFEELSEGASNLPFETLRAVLNRPNPSVSSGVRFSDAEVSEIFREFASDAVSFGFESFLHLLLSNHGADLFSADLEFRADSMDFPLSHYFVNTCVSNQNLFSSFEKADCSLEAYRQILLAGFRSIHLVCHPHEGEIVVRAGPSVAILGGEAASLEDFCAVIRAYAFRTTEMPLVIHLEHHCSLAQQRRIAAVLVDVFGNLLLKEPVADHLLEPDVALPSPSALRKKILISGKKKKPSQPDAEKGLELDDLYVYLQLESHPAKPGGLVPTDHYKIRSDFHSIEKAKYGNWYEQYNVHNMTRIWPDGAVVGVNVNPELYWASGCQMVAMAVLHPEISRPFQLNQTLFEENGRCGFVLKPECLRSADVAVDYKGWTIPGVRSVRVEVEVLSALFLSTLGVNKTMKTLSTQVQVDLYDTFNDHCVGKKRNRTAVVKHNSVNPAYVDDSAKRTVFVFEKVIKPEFAFLHFTVITNSGKEIAQRFMPVHRIRQGMNLVILRSETNQWIGPASVLVRFSVR
ncbi:hypothetical protein QR680_005081 [Steinernema hermaphroditum]|uniref:Phosphoinositide phospholipase C n=1 Tax=Steinernema hermaphroditum TaxID=289476 RepID=A0AA39HSZ7_9BILA|nr:hypothetical protein QR680_005081 [Steinernema hermaphroditum]